MRFQSLIERYLLYRMAWRAFLFGTGAVLYFSLDAEPSAASVFSVAAACVATALLCRLSRSGLAREASLLLCCLALGAASGKQATMRHDRPLLTEELPPLPLSARLDRLDDQGGRVKLYLSDPVLYSERGAERLPYRVRIGAARSLLQDGVLTGERLYVPRAALRPLPRPAVPGGYDFGFLAFFEDIGAVGYAIAPIYRESGGAAPAPPNVRVERLRLHVAESLSRHMGAPYDGLAAAFIVGMQGRVPAETVESVRHAGLAHLLSVSGTHVAMVTMLAFLLFRRLPACSAYLACRYDLKPVAAVAALVAAFCYTLLAGSPVSAQRSFLMAGIFLLGVALYRRATAMHGVGLAALAILAVEPQMVLHPGFQMSFFAVGAIIAHVDALRMRPDDDTRRDPALWQRVLFYVGSVMLSSLAASLATAPFSAYHFSRVSWLGLITNLIAIPLTGFLVMPLCLVFLLALPFGIEAPAAWGLEQSLRLFVALTESVRDFPLGSERVPAPSGPVMMMLVSGMAILYLAGGRARLIGLLPVAVAAVFYLRTPLPSVLIEERGRLLAFRLDGDERLYVTDKRAAAYVRERWQERLGLAENVPARLAPSDRLRCAPSGCVFREGEHDVALTQDATYAREHCARATFAVALSREAEAAFVSCRTANLVPFSALAQRGNLAVYLDGEAPRVEGAADKGAKRPWRARQGRVD
jgi:competence protein ComEC